MSAILDLFEIKKTETQLHQCLDYFENAKRDSFTEEILSQISLSLILLELVRDKTNQLEYSERVELSNNVFELKNNMLETIRAEGGSL